MKKLLIVLLILPALICAQDEDWKLVWDEDFDESEIDEDFWNFDLGGGGWGTNELQNYTNSRNNSFINNGTLVIQALNESGGYTSARLNTMNKFDTLYGKIEVRAILPTGSGTWPSFWMLGYESDILKYPASGEIDILETTGLDPVSIYGSAHGGNFHSGGRYVNRTGFADDFHTFGCEWYYDELRFYVDGNYYTNVTTQNVGNGT